MNSNNYNNNSVKRPLIKLTPTVTLLRRQSYSSSSEKYAEPY